jgi:hypothetical protein
MSNATVRVRVVVEVPVRSTWGSDCTVAQVQKQGIEEAVGALRRVVGSSGIRFVNVESCDMVVPLGDEK